MTTRLNEIDIEDDIENFVDNYVNIIILYHIIMLFKIRRKKKKL